MPIDSPRPDEQFDTLAQQRHAGLLAMWVFLSTELLLFGGLFAAFTVARIQHTAVFAEAAGHLDVTLASVNTALLLTSGLTMVLAEQSVHLERRRASLAFVAATVALGTVFLGIKALEWWREYEHNLMPLFDFPFHFPGYEPAAELFFNLYFILTGLHALHMLIGIGILVWFLVPLWRWRSRERLDRRARIVGLYWAFVDTVWIVVFTVLYLLRG